MKIIKTIISKLKIKKEPTLNETLILNSNSWIGKHHTADSKARTLVKFSLEVK